MNTFEETEVDLNFWKWVQISKTVCSHEDYAWQDVQAILQSFNNYAELS